MNLEHWPRKKQLGWKNAPATAEAAYVEFAAFDLIKLGDRDLIANANFKSVENKLSNERFVLKEKESLIFLQKKKYQRKEKKLKKCGKPNEERKISFESNTRRQNEK